MKAIKKLKDGSLPKRHQGRFNPNQTAPYELGRGRIENFMKCRGCFWLQQAAGVEFPGLPGFNLNTNTDTLLKRDLDQYRGKAAHPIFIENKLKHLIPFEHEDLEKWTQSIQFGASESHFNTVHEQTNIKFGGGLDDVLLNTKTGELHIVDYKSTAQLARDKAKIKKLDETFLLPPTNPKEPDYKASYRRQMDMYQWIMRRKGFAVSDIGYFVYVDGQHIGKKGMIDESNPNKANMEFNTAVIPYEADDSWVEKALTDAKHTLTLKTCPSHADGCENARFLADAKKALKIDMEDSQVDEYAKLMNVSGKIDYEIGES